MNVATTGVVLMGVCEVQSDRCIARELAPVTAVWTLPNRRQINVCRPCLEENIRAGLWSVEAAKIRSRADLSVYGSRGELILVVEVRQPLQPSSLSWKTWVRRIHRNLHAHSGIPPAEYVLVIGFPQYFALWREQEARPGRHPDFEGDLGATIERHREQPLGRYTPIRVGYIAESAVAAWLKSIISSPTPPADPHLKWIVRSGLYDRIHGGLVESSSTRHGTRHARPESD